MNLSVEEVLEKRNITLSEVKKSFFKLLKAFPEEIDVIKNAIIDGKIEGEYGNLFDLLGNCCGCFMGHIANDKNKSYGEIRRKVYSIRQIITSGGILLQPIEYFIYEVQTGDTHINNEVLAVCMEMIKEFEEKYLTKK